jgi:hypothetical protein
MTTSIWIISLIYWEFINCFYIIPDYQYGSCAIGYLPSYTEFIGKIAQKQRIKSQKHKKLKKDDTASTTVSPKLAGTNKQKNKLKLKLD